MFVCVSICPHNITRTNSQTRTKRELAKVVYPRFLEFFRVSLSCQLLSLKNGAAEVLSCQQPGVYIEHVQAFVLFFFVSLLQEMPHWWQWEGRFCHQIVKNQKPRLIGSEKGGTYMSIKLMELHWNQGINFQSPGAGTGETKS